MGKDNIENKNIEIIDENNNYNYIRKSKIYKTVSNGIGFGTCLAIVISYVANHSIGWAIIHGCLSWIYVIYYFFKYAESFF